MLRSMSAFKIKSSKKKRNDFTKHAPTKPTTTVHLPGPAAEKEKGWVKRHDPNYDTDYYENTRDGRVTWTPQREESFTNAGLDIPLGGADPDPNGGSPLPTRSPSSSPTTMAPLQHQMSVLGGELGDVSGRQSPLMTVQERKKQEKRKIPTKQYKTMFSGGKSKSKSEIKQETQDTQRKTPKPKKFAKQLTQLTLRPQPSMAVLGEDQPVDFQVGATLKNSKYNSQGSIKSFENANPMRQQQNNNNNNNNNNKAAPAFTYATSFTQDLPGMPDMRRSESWDIGLSFDSSYRGSGPGDVEMLDIKKKKKKKRRKKLGQSGAAYFFSSDWGLAKCIRIYIQSTSTDTPSVRVLEGFITSKALKATFEVAPFVIAPVMDPILCGERMTEFDVILNEKIGLNENEVSLFALQLEPGGRGKIALQTAASQVTSISFETDADDPDYEWEWFSSEDYPYHLESFSLATTATMRRASDAQKYDPCPSQVCSVFKPSSSNYPNNAAVSLSFFPSGDYEVATPGVEVNWDYLFRFGTCGVKVPPWPFTDFAFPDLLTVILSSSDGVIVQGNAEVSGYVEQNYLNPSDSTSSSSSSYTPVDFIWTSHKTQTSCNDPTLKMTQTLESPEPIPVSNSDSQKYTISAMSTTFVTSELTNSTSAINKKTLSLPLRGNPIEIEYDQFGDGILTSDWNIFARPKIANWAQTPSYVAPVTVQAQQTQTSNPNSKYTVAQMSETTRTYNDRSYKFGYIPEWMRGMSVVQPSNEDYNWPGTFDKNSNRNLFCTQVDANTEAAYVIMSNDAVIIPKWVNDNFERLSDVELTIKQSGWSDDDPAFSIYYHPLKGTRPCFGINAAEASNMYMVAFGDHPPRTTDRADILDLDLYSSIDASQTTSDFFITDGEAKITFDSNEISTVTITGAMTIRLHSIESTIPITVFISGGDENFRIEAKNVKLASFKSAVSSISPLSSSSSSSSSTGFLSKSIENKDRAFEGDFLFSTFPGEEGIRVQAKTYITMDNQLNLLMHNALFDVTTRIPFIYNTTSEGFAPFFAPTSHPDAFTFLLTSTVSTTSVSDDHLLSNSKLTVNVIDSKVYTQLESVVTLNTTNSPLLSANVEFYFDDFPLFPPDSSSTSPPVSTVEFSGGILAKFEPTQTSWFSIRAGGVFGTASFYQNNIVLDAFQVYAVPTITLPSRSSSIVVVTTSDPLFTYQTPNMYEINCAFTLTEPVETLKEVFQSSFQDVPAATYDNYVQDASKSISATLNVKIKNTGELFRLTTTIDSTLPPSSLIPASSPTRDSLTLKLYATASEQKLELATSISKIQFSPHFMITGVLFSGSVDLSTYAPTSPTYLDLSLSCTANLTMPSFSNSSSTSKHIFASATFSGTHHPATNNTALASTISMKNWDISDQLSLISGDFAISGDYDPSTAQWVFPEISFSSSAEVTLYNDPGSPKLAASTIGLLSTSTGQSTILATAKIQVPSDSSVTKLVPFSPTIPATSELTLLDSTFDVCVSSIATTLNNVDCIPGYVVSASVIMHPYLLNHLSNFGSTMPSSTLSLHVNAKGPEDSEDTVTLVANFLGKGIALSPAVTLNHIYLHSTTDFQSDDGSDDVSYSFQVSLDFANSNKPSLTLTGTGTFTDAALETTLTEDFSVTPAIFIAKGCTVSLDLTHDTGADTWAASSLSYSSCAIAVGSASLQSAATFDVTTSQYVITATSEFSNVLEAVSSMLDTTSTPSALSSVTIKDATQTTFKVDTYEDRASLTLDVDVTASSEISTALTDLSVDPAAVTISCSVSFPLSNPTWEASLVTFRVTAENLSIGPITVDTFELQVVHNEDSGDDLVIQSSSIFTLLSQKFLITGVTSFDDSVVDIAFKANLIFDPNNQFSFFDGGVVVTDGEMDVKLTKGDGKDDHTVMTAVLSGSANVRYSSTLSSSNEIVLSFMDNLDNHHLKVVSVSAADLPAFLSNFPFSSYMTSARGLAELTYTSKDGGFVGGSFTGKLVSKEVEEPVNDWLSGEPMTGVWALSFGCSVGSSNFTFHGSLGVTDLAIGDRFLVSAGTLSVAMGTGKNSTFDFVVNDGAIVTDKYEPGDGNTTIFFAASGKFDTGSNILKLSGTVNSPYSPFGDVVIQHAVFDVEVNTKKASIVKLVGGCMPSYKCMSSSFTTSSFSGELVILNNGKEVFARGEDISITDLEGVYFETMGSFISGQAISELDPLLTMDLTRVNVSFSNFESSLYEVPSGFFLEADGYVGAAESTTALENKLDGVKVDAFDVNFRVSFMYDGAGVGAEPIISVGFDIDTVKVFTGVELTGVTFYMNSMKDGLEVGFSSVVSVTLPTLSTPLVIVVEGEFNITEANVTKEIENDWSVTTSSKLASSFSWNPMGLQIFKLVEPILKLKFSDDEEGDIEVDDLTIASLNTSINECLVFHNPTFKVNSFDPQSFRLDALVSVDYKENEKPMKLDLSGVYKEVDVEGEEGAANFSSVMVDDWYMLGSDLVVVKGGGRLDIEMSTVLGRVASLKFEGDCDVVFDGETFTGLKLAGSSSGMLNEFCFEVDSIPVLDIATVLGQVLMGENATSAGKNLLLGVGGGVDLEVDSLVKDEYGDLKNGKFSIGSYSEECVKYVENEDIVDGWRVAFGVDVVEGGLMDLLKLVDESLVHVNLVTELVVPVVRSSATPLVFEGKLAMERIESVGGEGFGVKSEEVKLALKMTDKDSLTLSSAEVGFDLTVSFADGGNLKFGVVGSAVEVEEGGWSMDASGETADVWRSPFGMDWLQISSGSVGFSCSSSSTWEETKFDMMLKANFLFEAEVEVLAALEVAEGGEEFKLVSTLSSSNLVLWNVLTTVGEVDNAGEDDALASYFDDIVTSEEVVFVLSTVDGKIYSVGDTVLGVGYRRGVTVSADLVAHGGMEGSSIRNLLGFASGINGGSVGLKVELYADVFVEGGSGIPVEFSVVQKGASVVFGGTGGAYLHSGNNDGYLEILDFAVIANFVTGRSSESGVKSSLTAMWRPSVGTEMEISFEGTPTSLRGAIEVWDAPLGLGWLSLTDVIITVRFIDTGLRSWKIEEFKFSSGGSAIIGGVQYTGWIEGLKVGDDHDQTRVAVKMEYDRTGVGVGGGSNNVTKIASAVAEGEGSWEEWNWLNQLRVEGEGFWSLEYANYDDVGAGVRKGVVGKFTAVLAGERRNFREALELSNVEEEEGLTVFSGGVFVPIFGSNKRDVEMFIEVVEFDVFDDILHVEVMRVSVSAVGAAFSLVGDVKFSNNPRLDVVLTGVVGGGKASLMGSVVSQWKDAFGVKGLTLVESGVSVGLGSGSVSIGCSSKFSIGTVQVMLSGAVSVIGDSPSNDMSLYGSLTGLEGEVQPFMAISVRDLAEWYNDEVLGEGSAWRFNPDIVPASWGLYDSYFMFTTESMVVNGKDMEAGFLISTGLKIFGLNCSATVSYSKGLDNLVIDINAGLNQASEVARAKLIDEILPEELVDPSKLTNDQRQIKQDDDGLNFNKPFFQIVEVGMEGLDMKSFSSNVMPRMRVEFEFWGVRSVLEIEVDDLYKFATVDLWEVFESFREFSDGLFSLPECLWDGDCYDESSSSYCVDVCDPLSEKWYGECPKESKECYIDDQDCFSCFGSCRVFKCVY
ncbi:hypothetical protein TrLO_g15527 [Triparma laevis f. longispina]|uniref:Uncharacterized protein n=1 Tax=Triparma laevis f. longispina TaxID=1714387 RepID=A0A9W7FF52_9STRA|nr:hypothetical protein TrLO_g15527 [Triparma laevis f. longispina]